MSKVTVKLDTTAVRKLILQSEMVKEECERAAQSKCGSDCHIKSFIGYDRAHAIIYPNTKEHK